ncbi:MAG: DUF5602 domain-containing protein [Gammaproteobacteria bacterium]|nr:DUF5602 domain-containing protein [Gammaproteobacteria bacterium]MDH3467330.1 DUF5602 domain-containing protein [Gammaproteobacteria bacterium]
MADAMVLAGYQLPAYADTAVGETKLLRNGTIRSVLKVDAAGLPLSLWVKLTEIALSCLPGSGDHESSATVLRFPTEAQLTPFDHVSIDWNPQGHPPTGVYDVPHFDFPFDLIPGTDRDLITVAVSDFKAKGLTSPAAHYLPAG